MVTASAFANELRLFTQAKPGRFSETPDLVIPGPAETNRPTALAVGDLDGDGDFDLVSANLSGPSLVVFLQRRSRAFEFSQRLRSNAGGGAEWSALAAVDVNGDAALELISSSDETFLVVGYTQRVPGQFDGVSSFGFFKSRAAVSPALLASDLDANGSFELISTDINGIDLFVQGMDWQYVLSPRPLQTEDGVRPRNAVVGDFNDDRRLDIASVNFPGGASSVALFWQDEDGLFPQRPSMSLDGAFAPELLPGLPRRFRDCSIKTGLLPQVTVDSSRFLQEKRRSRPGEKGNGWTWGIPTGPNRGDHPR